jgi:hypothetical protein
VVECLPNEALGSISSTEKNKTNPNKGLVGVGLSFKNLVINYN